MRGASASTSVRVREWSGDKSTVEVERVNAWEGGCGWVMVSDVTPTKSDISTSNLGS